MIKIILVLIVLGLGLYYILMSCKTLNIENFSNVNTKERCPNMLIQHNNEYYLLNNNLARVPGVNPIRFSKLEEYTEFLEWQKGHGINCPILHLQYSTDPQNNQVIRIRPNIFENRNQTLETGNNPKHLLPFSSDDRFNNYLNTIPNTVTPPFSFRRFDNQFIGRVTPADKI